MYSSNYDNLFVALGAFALIIGLIVLAVLVVYLVALWKVFVKAGKQGWEAIIPFYNSWILVEIAGLNCGGSYLSFPEQSYHCYISQG